MLHPLGEGESLPDADRLIQVQNPRASRLVQRTERLREGDGLLTLGKILFVIPPVSNLFFLNRIECSACHSEKDIGEQA